MRTRYVHIPVHACALTLFVPPSWIAGLGGPVAPPPPCEASHESLS